MWAIGFDKFAVRRPIGRQILEPAPESGEFGQTADGQIAHGFAQSQRRCRSMM